MGRVRLAGLLLLAGGLACLLLAPHAVSCVSGSDYRVCETIGTVVLNVVGAVQVATGVGMLLLPRGKATT
jgi:hypothetical protein